MRKRDELADPTSCLNRARDDEFVFVLLDRDDAALDTVRDWIARRIKLGKNKPDDAQIIEAWHWIAMVEIKRKDALERRLSAGQKDVPDA